MKILPVNAVNPNAYVMKNSHVDSKVMKESESISPAPLNASSYGITFGAKMQLKTIPMLMSGSIAAALAASYDALLDDETVDIDDTIVLEHKGEKYYTDIDTISEIRSAANILDYFANKSINQKARTNEEVAASETLPAHKAYYNSKGELIRRVFDDKTEYILNLADKGVPAEMAPRFMMAKSKDGSVIRTEFAIPAVKAGELETSNIIEKNQDGEYIFKRYIEQDHPSNGEYYGYFRKLND